jgi:hypothetical protein
VNRKGPGFRKPGPHTPSAPKKIRSRVTRQTHCVPLVPAARGCFFGVINKGLPHGTNYLVAGLKGMTW